jgi:hypothetical protein
MAGQQRLGRHRMTERRETPTKPANYQTTWFATQQKRLPK